MAIAEKRPQPTVKEQTEGLNSVYHHNPDHLRPFGQQLRMVFAEGALADLAASIQRIGLQQPIVIRWNPGVDGDGRRTDYEIVAGERRWRACRQLKMFTIPCIERRMTDEEAIEVHLIENLHRADLNPIELARGYRAYLDATGATQAELGKKLGKAQSTVANTLRLLGLSEPIQAKIVAGEMTEADGRTLLSLKPESANMFAFVGGHHISGAELAKHGGNVSGAALAEGVKSLNAQAARAESEKRSTERELSKAEKKAEEIRARGDGDVRTAPNSYSWPEGTAARPAFSTRAGPVTHERCSTACPHPVVVCRPDGSVGSGCRDAECRIAVLAELEQRHKEAAAARSAMTVEYRKRALESLTPADRRRLCLYFIRELGHYIQEDTMARNWLKVPADVFEEDLVAGLLDRLLQEAVAESGYDYTVPKHAALRLWLFERARIPEDWLLGNLGQYARVKLEEIRQILAGQLIPEEGYGERNDPRDITADMMATAGCEVCIPANCDRHCGAAVDGGAHP